jgi:class 3 adenylate cyclase
VPFGNQIQHETAAGRPGKDHETDSGHRLVAAERQGLRLAVLCRTIAVAIASAWWIGFAVYFGISISPWAIIILLGMVAFGIATILLIGTPFDRRWLKFVIYTVDILGVCAMFAFVPVRSGEDVPQIIAFRAYGIHFLFPLIALACLSLSWRLVLWSGVITAVGWWAAFLYVIADMDRWLGWSDFPADANRADYQAIFLSMDFVGFGNRAIESGTLFIAASILSLAVFRARRVFFAQIQAETERGAERRKRERIGSVLGRYVPEAIANRLIDDEAVLAPQERHAVVLVMDVAKFTDFAANRPPFEVIDKLNGFLSRAASTVSQHDGVVIQFTGDGLLATFNTPIEITAPEQAALAAAHLLVDVAQDAGFNIRIGLAAGTVAAGSVGSSHRQAYTVYGDTVNRAARLESLAKQLDTAIVLDAECAKAIGDRESIASAGAHKIRGMPEPIDVWIVR